LLLDERYKAKGKKEGYDPMNMQIDSIATLNFQVFPIPSIPFIPVRKNLGSDPTLAC